jgi:hypothetical protein
MIMPYRNSLEVLIMQKKMNFMMDMSNSRGTTLYDMFTIFVFVFVFYLFIAF